MIPAGKALLGAGVEPVDAGVEGAGLWRLDEKGKRVTRDNDTNRRRRSDNGAGGWRCRDWVFTIRRDRSSAKGLCVWLRSLPDRLSEGRVEENIMVIGWILGLHETNQFRIGRSLLAKHRVPVRRRISGDILERETAISRSVCVVFEKPTGGVFFSVRRYSFARDIMLA